MADQIEEIIREIAAKHGIAVARDDPILVLQTINHRLLQDGATAQQTMLEQFKEELEGVSMRWKFDAKEKAEQVLNAALAGSVEAMNRNVQETAGNTARAIQPIVEQAFSTLAVQVQRGRQAAILNLVSCCISMATMFAILWIR